MLSRVPQLFIILSAIYGTLGLIGVCLLFDYRPDPSEDTSIQTIDSSVNDSIDSFSGDLETLMRCSTPLDSNVSVRRALRTRLFPIFWSTFALSTQTVYFVNSMIKAYGSRYISDDHFLAVILSFSFIVNGIGGLFWGRVLDRFGFKVSDKILFDRNF